MVSDDGPIVAGGIPSAEVDIDERLVRGLLRAQHPDLASLSLRQVATGWDNVTYRLGGFLASLHREPPAGFPRNDYRGIPRAGLGALLRRDTAGPRSHG